MATKMIRKILLTQRTKLPSCILSTYYHNSVNNLVREFETFYKRSDFPEAFLDLDYLFKEDNRNIMENNMKLRKTHLNLNELYQLYKEFKLSKDESLRKNLLEKALHIPNLTHPNAPKTEDFEILKLTNEKQTYDFKPKTFLSLSSKNGLCKTEQISHYLGNRSYYFTTDLCLLESAIIQYVLEKLLSLNFQLITVPDILPEDVIKKCGMNTRGERSQVYHLESDFYGEGWCLSGTAEMGIAWHLMNQTMPDSELPTKLAAMSKCYRAEISDVGGEKGVYRVHCFTKIEMFGVTQPEASERELDALLHFEETLFSELGLHTRTLNMGARELGAQAYRKYDVEAWMPGGKRWGELSSCSDCTDYQARRLNIKSGKGHFVHTINGTACAIPRLLIALVETHQNKDGTITIPACLQPYMFNKAVIGETRQVPELFKVKQTLSKAKKKEMAKAALREKAANL